MPSDKIKEFLDRRGVRYKKYHHAPVYTSQKVTAVSCVAGKELAKSVLIKVDGKMKMCVLPASCPIDLDQLKKEFGGKNIELAKDVEFGEFFPDCEFGAVPPFGNLFGLDVYVSKSLTDDTEIAFNAGSHSEVISMGYRDYNRLVNPKVLQLSKPD